MSYYCHTLLCFIQCKGATIFEVQIISNLLKINALYVYVQVYSSLERLSDKIASGQYGNKQSPFMLQKTLCFKE